MPTILEVQTIILEVYGYQFNKTEFLSLINIENKLNLF